ncbi:MAG TPA: LPXTG cell wall anchor domain-containing protein [Chitinophagaceae bacterium]|jgi:LPXTG-motif cell wall-anchored protein|nr:LPXTG cell wall anchor domain-containing protein [Chitinophagaceae bacterium]
MLQLLLDLSPEPTLAEKAKSNIWLIVIAIVALVGIAGFFIWKNRKNKKKSQ